MDSGALIRFVLVEKPSMYPEANQVILASLLPSNLNDPNIIDWVLAELEGCSFLFPLTPIIVDWQDVEQLSYAFVRKLSELRHRVKARGGQLKLTDHKQLPGTASYIGTDGKAVAQK